MSLDCRQASLSTRFSINASFTNVQVVCKCLFWTRQEKQNRIHWICGAFLEICSFNFGTNCWVCTAANVRRGKSWNTEKRPVTHHVVQVIKSIQKKFALVLRQSHVLQPVAHGLVQQPASGTCWQGEALQQGETLETVAAAFWRWDVALPHHPRPTEPSTPAAGTGWRQCPPWTGGQLPQSGGGWTTLAQDRFQRPWCQGWWER